MRASLSAEAARQLAEYLLEHLIPIRSQVLAEIRAHSDEIPTARSLSDEALLDHLPQLFVDLGKYLLSGADPQMRAIILDTARKHGETRASQGYQLTELIREIGIVHSLIVDYGLEPFLLARPDLADSADGFSKVIGTFFEDSVVGSIQRYVDKFNDEARQANEKLRAANQRLSELDAFRLQLVRTFHHELGNALNALNFSIEFVTQTPDASTQREMLGACRRSVREMAALLTQLDDYALLLGREAPVQSETIDVAQFARELEVSLLAMIRDAGMSLEMQVDPKLHVIQSDRARIKQIVNNLVTNAIKYRKPQPSEGRMVIQVRSLSAESWELSVEDFGIGIPQEHLESIFNEFQRFPPSEQIAGRGLGLAITKHLVEELKGVIKVTSEVDQGTRFVVTLPKQIGS
ncbi:MAG: HAMP domain-containing histidine kinase [Verrucomicrobia bacterium]|nr:HAMP domain-containing histidine kinase [Verrucomicrobiota bacterium]